MRGGFASRRDLLRAFLSFDIDSGQLRSSVEELQQEFAQAGADIKPVDLSILHFTIRFLGEIDETQKQSIVRALEGKAKPIGKVEFVGLGVFPNESKISVIWIGVDENSVKELNERARKVNEELDSSGKFHSDARGFSPHVTIARVKTGRNRQELVSLVSKHRKDHLGECVLGPLRLKLSSLGSAGPTYSDLHVFKE
ncbi:MAG TPA: RNA 2',3'-cyclic phosphodiesterase [Nitrososphaerales archaeon]|nr:RNA 2',3'-cyclic phosphodiesterase [Nitrososphaerales archaeon]